MNSLTEEEIRKSNIQYRILVITLARKVVNKYHHLETVQAKINVMNHQIKEFIELFNPLFKRGPTFFWEEKGGIWSQKEYTDRLISYRFNHIQFDDMQHQTLSRKLVIKKFAGDFEMLFDFKATCTKLRDFCYLEIVELRVLEKDMINLDLPTTDQWKIIENYGKSKYKLHK